MVWGSRIRPQIYIYMNRIKSYDIKCTKKKKKRPYRPLKQNYYTPHPHPL